MKGINTSELREILDTTPSWQNIMLSGKHGIGKSQILTEYYAEKGLPVVTLFLGQMSDPGDLIGLPHFNADTRITEFIPPYWFPLDDRPVVLFLDELNRARPEILQTIMDLALNRKLAGRSLPEGSRIISAVNCGNEYELTDLDPALVSRFNIYSFEPEVDEWLEWARRKGIDSRIIDYIQKKPNRLDSYVAEDADNLTKTPDRRGWEKASALLKETELKPSHIKMLTGIVGYDTAADFIATESKVQKQKVSGNDILTEGKSCFGRLVSLKVQEYAELIDSILGILETSGKGSYRANLYDLVLWLKEKNIYEPLAYLTTQIASNTRPQASGYIQQNCPEIMEQLRQFVESYEHE